MTAKAKIYVGHTVLVPWDWAHAAGAEHHAQIDVVVVATSKAEAEATLAVRVGQWEGKHLAAELRIAREGQYDNKVERLLGAGLLQPAAGEPVVLLYRRGIKDDPIVAVAPDNSKQVIGHFRYEEGHREFGEYVRGRGLYVEASA